MYYIPSFPRAIRYLFLPGLFALIVGSICSTPCYAGMPQLSPEEQAEFEEFMQSPEGQQFIKELEKATEEFNKLPPEEQEKLKKEAEDELKRLGIDPNTYTEPTAPPAPSIKPETPQAPQEPTRDYSPVTIHSEKEVFTLLQNTISYIEVIQQKISLIIIDTSTIHEWLSSLLYYMKMINEEEHIKSLTSITFSRLYDLITDLEKLLRSEATSLIVFAEEEFPDDDNPYALLGIPYDAPEEEIKKAYDQKMAEHDPIAREEELKKAQIDPIKIKRRINQAVARQAAFTEAYNQLKDPQLREQLDRSRSKTLERQLSLRNDNAQSIERLHNGLNELIQQGLIKELEAFFARYAPTELQYHQNMEKAEKERFAEQKATAGLNLIPSPLGGNNSPSVGYQPPSYYPEDSYYSGYHHPNFSDFGPQEGGGPFGGGSGGSAPGAQPGGDKSKGEKGEKGDKKKDEKDKDKKKKDEKNDGKKGKDDVEQIVKEFTKLLEGLRGAITEFQEYIQADEQEGVRANLDSLNERRTKTSKPITDDSFGKLHTALKRHIKTPLINKLQEIEGFIKAKVISNKKALDACRALWESHYSSNTAYAVLGLICKHADEAIKKDNRLGEKTPWNNIGIVCKLIESIKKTFKKPEGKDDKSKKEKDGGKKSISQKPLGKEETDEEETKKKAKPPTLEEIQAAIEALAALYEKTEKNLSDSEDEYRTTIERLNIALKNKKLEEILKLRDDVWTPYLDHSGFSVLQKLESQVKELVALLITSEQQNIPKSIEEQLPTAEKFPLTYKIKQLNKNLNTFLYPGPHEKKETTEKAEKEESIKEKSFEQRDAP